MHDEGLPLITQRTRETPFAFIAQLGDIIDGVNVELGQSERALEARA